MPSLLIKDTTREEREAIVARSIAEMEDSCDGCSPRLADMYQDYIEGKRELREINMAYRAGYVSGMQGPDKRSCMMGY